MLSKFESESDRYLQVGYKIIGATQFEWYPCPNIFTFRIYKKYSYEIIFHKKNFIYIYIYQTTRLVDLIVVK